MSSTPHNEYKQTKVKQAVLIKDRSECIIFGVVIIKTNVVSRKKKKGPIDVLRFLTGMVCFHNTIIAYRILLTIYVTISHAF